MYVLCKQNYRYHLVFFMYYELNFWGNPSGGLCTPKLFLEGGFWKQGGFAPPPGRPVVPESHDSTVM